MEGLLIPMKPTNHPNYPDDCPSPDFDPESIYDNPPDYVSLRDAYLELLANVSRDTARLNSGTILLTVHGERVHYVAQDLRAAIDAGIAANVKVSHEAEQP